MDFKDMNGQFVNLGKEFLNQYYEGLRTSLKSAQAMADKTKDVLGPQLAKFGFKEDQTNEVLKHAEQIIELGKKNQLLIMEMTQKSLEIFLNKEFTLSKDEKITSLEERIAKLEKQLAEKDK